MANKQTHVKPLRKMAELRKEKGLTQAELAAKVGVQRMTIYYYEAGVREPSITMLIKIATALDTSIACIVNE